MPGKPSFSEAWHDADGEDPLDGRHTDFDWPGLEQALGESDLTATELERLADALRQILVWILPARLSAGVVEKVAGRRALALCWVIAPELLEGSPSLSQIAGELGVSKGMLSRHTADFHRTFGVSNRAQSHGANFKPEGGANVRT